MTRFSEYLEWTILRSGIKEKDLAKASGFARSYIALMKNGQRVSPDTEKMEKLMLALNLTPYEMKSFKDEYHRARIGDDAYDRDSAVMDFLQSFNNSSKIQIRSKHEYEIPDVKIVDNKVDLEKIINAVIRKESVKHDGYIHIIMQGTGNILKETLPCLRDSSEKLTIEHIVCMEYCDEHSIEKNQLYNLKMLRELIPVVICNHNYRIYYYYDHVMSRFNTGKLLSHMILTSEYLICADSDLSMGMLIKDEEIRVFYEELFQKNKNNCREMILYFQDEMEMQNFQYITDEGDGVTYSVSQQPCLGVLKLDGIIKKYMNRINRQMLLNLEKINKKNNLKVQQENNKHISFCTKKGIIRFVKEGVIDELPKEINSFLKIQDRKYIIEMLLEMIEKGKYELYLIDEEEYEIAKELFINIYGESELLIMYLSENQSSRFVINETSTAKAIYESVRNLTKNPKTSSADEGINFIRNLLTEL